jgi:hypothetical protein
LKKLILVSSIVLICFVTIFFIVEIITKRNNLIMSAELQTILGIGFLIISICIFVFLIVVLLRKVKIPASIEVNLLEIFIAAILMLVVSFFLILGKSIGVI